MARVTNQEVTDTVGETGGTGLTLAIEMATELVTEVLGSSSLSTARLKAVELYLASHFYYLSLREGPLASQELGQGKERYHNIYKGGLRASRFGQQVLVLDTTGTFAKMTDRADDPGKKDASFEVI